MAEPTLSSRAQRWPPARCPPILHAGLLPPASPANPTAPLGVQLPARSAQRPPACSPRSAAGALRPPLPWPGRRRTPDSPCARPRQLPLNRRPCSPPLAQNVCRPASQASHVARGGGRGAAQPAAQPGRRAARPGARGAPPAGDPARRAAGRAGRRAARAGPRARRAAAGARGVCGGGGHAGVCVGCSAWGMRPALRDGGWPCRRAAQQQHAAQPPAHPPAASSPTPTIRSWSRPKRAQQAAATRSRPQQQRQAAAARPARRA